MQQAIFNKSFWRYIMSAVKDFFQNVGSTLTFGLIPPAGGGGGGGGGDEVYNGPPPITQDEVNADLDKVDHMFDFISNPSVIPKPPL
jgi:hypothetical protein